MNVANQTITHGTAHHKRGQTIAVQGVRGGGEQPICSIKEAEAAAVNLLEVNDGTNQGQEISAQKKYKLELQAEINKLRSKYQDFTHNQNDVRLNNNQVSPSGVANQVKPSSKK